jgi:hypothetical protein
MSGRPRVTVFMPVYNGRSFLDQSIGSILGQVHGDFEFLIIDDRSTDGSFDYLEGLKDSRIRVLRQPTNQGVRGTYNRGLAEAKGEFIAIMDQDDISEPDRIGLQLRFMEAHPDVGLCGSQITLFGDKPGPSWVRYFGRDDLKIALLFENPICHPSVMLRSAVLRTYGLGYPVYPFAEEYALWIRISRVAKLANLEEPLLRYRTHPGQVSRKRSELQSHSVGRLIEEQLDELGVAHRPRDLVIHNLLGTALVPVPCRGRILSSWVARIEAANAKSGTYRPEVLSARLAERAREGLDRNLNVLRSMSLRRRMQWCVAAMVQYYGAKPERAAPPHDPALKS